MGEIPNKTYKTADGKIYRVETDGSVTYLGNVNENHQKPQKYPNTPLKPKKSIRPWVWGVIALGIACILGILGVVAVYIFTFMDRSYPSQGQEWSDPIEYECTQDSDYWSQEAETWPAAEEVILAQGEEEATSSDGEAVYYSAPAFSSYQDRAYYYFSDNGGYFCMNFYSNGLCDIYDGGALIDSGQYRLDGRYIIFSYFDYWPNGSVFLFDDDSFQYNGVVFRH